MRTNVARYEYSYLIIGTLLYSAVKRFSGKIVLIYVHFTFANYLLRLRELNKTKKKMY